MSQECLLLSGADYNMTNIFKVLHDIVAYSHNNVEANKRTPNCEKR